MPRSGRPILLDLFCGAGGCTKGYQEAGFHVVGVDIDPQPNYCGDVFLQADAMRVLQLLTRDGLLRIGDDMAGMQFRAIHASPPCQAFADVTKWTGNQADHPELVAPTRKLLLATGLPYVMENVRKAPLRACYMLCGSMFGLPIRRHRYFETNWADPTKTWGSVPPCGHSPDDFSFDHGGKQLESVYRDAMGCGWMTVEGSRQAIPPAYAKFIGTHLLEHLEHPTELLKCDSGPPHRCDRRPPLPAL
jgi:hypothetical protein